MELNTTGIRENRPNRYTVLGGNSADIARDFEKGCIRKAERSFEQGRMCTEINGMAALMSLQDAVFVVHAPQGCIGCSVVAEDFYKVGQLHRGIKHVKNAHVIVTNLDANDVVFGGQKKLAEAIHKALERYSPKLVFVFSSCASAMIGDDIDAVVAEEQKNTNAILVPIHCEGFKSKINPSGFDSAFIAVSKYILKDEKIPKIPNLVNLFAPTTVSYKDQQEIERILSIIGLQANFIPFFGSLESFKRIPAAIASTSICKVFADEFMIELEQKFGIPYSHTVMPIGVRNTDEWLRGIAKATGKEKEAEEFIAKEHARIEPLVAEIKEHLKGKRVFVTGGTGRSFAAAALVDDFGMKLVGLRTPVYDDDAHKDLTYLNGIHKNFTVDVTVHAFEQINLLKRLKPDVVIGVSPVAGKLGIPTTHILGGKRCTMGYDGLLYLGHLIMDQLENPSFNKKIAAHAHLPYREKWYKEDPLKYIVQTQNKE